MCRRSSSVAIKYGEIDLGAEMGSSSSYVEREQKGTCIMAFVNEKSKGAYKLTSMAVHV